MWKIFEKKRKEIAKDLVDDAVEHIQKKAEEKTQDTLEWIIPLIFLMKDFAPLLSTMGKMTETAKASKAVFNNCTFNIFMR